MEMEIQITRAERDLLISKMIVAEKQMKGIFSISVTGYKNSCKWFVEETSALYIFDNRTNHIGSGSIYVAALLYVGRRKDINQTFDSICLSDSENVNVRNDMLGLKHRLITRGC